MTVRRYSTCPQSSDVDHTEYTRTIIDAARWSERTGFHGMLIYTDNRIVDPWLVAQVLVQNTARLVPLVAVQPAYMHPYAAAKMVATIAFMHRRKVELNLLAGGFLNDLLALGDNTPHDDRYARTSEYGEIVMRLLTGEAVTFTGTYYRVDKLKLQVSVPPELRPAVIVSGSSEAGIETARRLGATAIMYPGPPDEPPLASPAGLDHGVRIGVIARATDEEAWAVALERFPEDRKGQIAHTFAMRVSDSHWHRHLSERQGEQAAGRAPYWLGPFQNSHSFCPYIVGGYGRVAEVIAEYVRRGSTTFILDIPPSEEELEHTSVTFDRAQAAVAP